MNHKYKILFDAYHLYHLPQFDPVIDLLAQDGRFELFLSISSEIEKGERELALSIMEKRPGSSSMFRPNKDAFNLYNFKISKINYKNMNFQKKI